jgi:hypothetical protein
LEGGFLYWRPSRTYKRRLWGRTSLSKGVPYWNLEARFVTGDFERVKEGFVNEATPYVGTL